jgi:hypothetical protein
MQLLPGALSELTDSTLDVLAVGGPTCIESVGTIPQQLEVVFKSYPTRTVAGLGPRRRSSIRRWESSLGALDDALADFVIAAREDVWQAQV